MLFILQDVRESDAMNIEIEELRSELDNNSEHSYIIVKSGFFKKMNKDIDLKNAVPVGTLEFVQSYLYHAYGIKTMSPIEIPEVLRKEKFLLRKYEIFDVDHIPRDRNAFVKDVTELKQQVYMGNTNVILDQAGRPFFKEGHLYQVSDIMDIMAEYRVTVLHGQIMGIQFYDGYCTIMPNEKEILKIQEMVVRYSQDKNCPDAYAMDVGIVKTNDEKKRDLAVIEIQSYASMGSYGLRGAFLPRLYKNGLKWYLKQ